MKIAVIGSGNVGGTLGTRWAKAGHTVVFGSRDAGSAKMKELLAAAGANAGAASVADAVKASDVVVLATPWAAAEDAIRAAGSLVGKILIDTTNPLSRGPAGLSLAVGHTTSAAEEIARLAKGARVVKAFNTTGFSNMANPAYGTRKAAMFVCGDDTEAKATAKQLSDELGFDTIDAGPLAAARYLEPAAMLWIHLAMVMGLGRDFAFGILRR